MIKQNRISPLHFSGLMEDLLNSNTGRFFKDDTPNEEWIRNSYQVPVNVKESDLAFHVDIIAPGVAKEELQLNINDKTLTVSFDKKEEELNEGAKWLRRAFKVRSFKRVFTLDDKVDAEKITATYTNGILHLELPKKEAAIAVNKAIDIQ